MRRLLTILFSVFFLLSTSLWAGANCFGRSHVESSSSLAHELSAEPHEHGDNHHGNGTAHIHCPEIRFALGASRLTTSSTLNVKLRPIRFARVLDPTVPHGSFQMTNLLIELSIGFPPYSLQAGVAPHLFFSVLRV